MLHSIDDDLIPVDVTTQAKKLYKWVNDHIWELNRLQKEPEELRIAPGTQCTDPYECWYYGYCHNTHIKEFDV